MQNSCLKTKDRKTCFRKMYMGRPWWKQIQGKTISKWWRVRGGESWLKLFMNCIQNFPSLFYIYKNSIKSNNNLYLYLYIYFAWLHVCLSIFPLVCTAVVCSTLTEELMGFSGEWSAWEVFQRSEVFINHYKLAEVPVK